MLQQAGARWSGACVRVRKSLPSPPLILRARLRPVLTALIDRVRSRDFTLTAIRIMASCALATASSPPSTLLALPTPIPQASTTPGPSREVTLTRAASRTASCAVPPRRRKVSKEPKVSSNIKKGIESAGNVLTAVCGIPVATHVATDEGHLLAQSLNHPASIPP